LGITTTFVINTPFKRLGVGVTGGVAVGGSGVGVSVGGKGVSTNSPGSGSDVGVRVGAGVSDGIVSVGGTAVTTATFSPETAVPSPPAASSPPQPTTNPNNTPQTKKYARHFPKYLAPILPCAFTFQFPTIKTKLPKNLFITS
jgi:hypothetical protein